MRHTSALVQSAARRPPARTLRATGLAALTAASLALDGCSARLPPRDNAAPQPPPRAIVISFDALNERRVLSTVTPSRIPALRALFAEGACAASARPAFPSVTAAGHAAIWTGSYGRVNGVTANTVLRLPASRHSILETANGFGAAVLRAEPIWISAALEGRSVFGHHVTQAPGAPGYAVDDGEPADTFAVARKRAERALTAPNLAVLNGYNRTIVTPAVLTAANVQLTEAGWWRGLSRDTASSAFEFGIPLRDDGRSPPGALYVLLRLWPRADSAQAWVSAERDLAHAVPLVAHAEEEAPVRGRPLARYFSDPVTIRLADGRRASMRLRLFALSARDTSFTLFVPGMQLADANRDALTEAYDDAVPGWVGNSAVSLWQDGAFGTTLVDGGDGVAERRWLESAELLVRGFVEGSAWGWHQLQPQLMLDYFPLGDDTDHSLWGFLDRASPRFDAGRTVRAAALRDRLWELVDLRLEGLMALVRTTPGARLYVAGDHGMRAAWRRFRPNVALRQAGLLALDSAGQVDLSRSRAASANGYWISVSRLRRRGGIVAPQDEGAVLDAVRDALLAVRDEQGRPVVTRVIDIRDPAADSLGIGGPTGGDVFYDLAPGYMWNAGRRGPVVEDAARTTGEHGFPSTSPDMPTVSCAWSPTLPAARDPAVRPLTDVSRLVRRFLGMPESR